MCNVIPKYVAANIYVSHSKDVGCNKQLAKKLSIHTAQVAMLQSENKEYWSDIIKQITKI